MEFGIEFVVRVRLKVENGVGVELGSGLWLELDL